MGENNSVLETSGDGLASDLDEIDRPIETDGGVVAQRDVERESRLISTREPPHRGFEQRSPKPAAAAVLAAPGPGTGGQPLQMGLQIAPPNPPPSPGARGAARLNLTGTPL